MSKKSIVAIAAASLIFSACSAGTDTQPAASSSATGDATAGSDASSSGQFTKYEAGTHTVGDLTFTLPGPASLAIDEDGTIRTDPAQSPEVPAHVPAYQHEQGNEQFYFVMTDRFANGDTSNDFGGYDGDPRLSGHDPANEGFYLGGDIAGLTQNLDYIEGLGTTAIWLTPPFKNKPIQGDGENASAGYHGYWITDFTQIDPHYGTNDEMKEFIDEAHSRDIKVYFDIITNHTADVITYEEGEFDYIPTTVEPYTDADGNPINTYELAGQEFPELDPATSFPYTPVIGDENIPGENTKVPEWLNDVTLYHNRGNSTWTGESVTYGDFDGLDDLMTENKQVVDGMAEIYRTWTDLGIDGFRIDTAKHVNFEFWEDFTQQIRDHAGKEFFMFGEVFDTNVDLLSRYPRESEMNSVLDFAYQASMLTYVNGGGADGLSQLFTDDDRYTTATSSAGDLPTFLGNHDMGRVGYLVQGGGNEPQKFELAHAMLFLTRGQPVIYYGDEQGFVGNGGDKIARQPLFPTDVVAYQGQELLDGTQFGTGEHTSTDTAEYQLISELSQLRADNPALSDGPQIELLAEGSVYAFSRIDPETMDEYIVVANSRDAADVDVPVLSEDGSAELVWQTSGADAQESVDVIGSRVALTAPETGVVVYKSAGAVMESTPEHPVQIADLSTYAAGGDKVEVRATLGRGYSEVSVFARVVGTNEWQLVGTDVGPNVRMFHDVASIEPNSIIEYAAVSADSSTTMLTYAMGGNHEAAPEVATLSW